MRLLFLIQSHRDPDQIARLARVLRTGCPGSIILISHDCRAQSLSRSLWKGDSKIHVIPGRGGRGDFNILDGYLAATRWLSDHKIDYDWITNLSGQDYPVSSLADFSRELSQTSHDGFLQHFDVLTRLAIEHLTELRIKTAYGLMIGRPAKRPPFAAEFRCYAGSYWHTIRRRCVDYLLDFCETRSPVVEYFRKVLIPDESFVQTVLANHQDFRFANDNRRYVDMRRSRRGHPKILTDIDIPQFAGRRYVFARKFEWKSGPTLFDKLDGYALDRTGPVAADAAAG
jgi:hypothetical protein